MTRRALWLLLVLGACQDNAVTPAATANYRDIPADQIVINMEQYVTEAGRRRAVLRGDTAYVHDDSMKAHIINVNLTMFDENGAESAHLTSKTGDFSNVSQAMVARGNVVLVIRGPNARTIETEELHYDPNTHRVWSTVATTMREGTSTVSGSGFEADDKFENVRITDARSTGGGLRLEF